MEQKDIRRYDGGRNSLLNYLNDLVKQGQAVLIEKNDKDYCEAHELYIANWKYQLKVSKLTIELWSGPMKYSTDLKKYDSFSLKVEHPDADKNISKAVIKDLEKIMERKEIFSF